MMTKEKMMMRFISTVFLLLGFFHLSMAQSPAQKHSPAEFRLVNWNSGQGLYYGRVNCFLKDKNGFLWVGTEGGLNRFDGSLFKNYQNPSGGNHTTIGNFILGLTEDSLHNIWAGTDKGISRYDIKADSFTHFLPGNVFDQPIVPFWATANLVYCVESDTVITAYDINSLQKKKICLLPQRLYAWYENTFSVLEPDSNCVWMLSSNGDGALLRVSLSDGKQQVYKCPSFMQDPHIRHFSESMCYDKKRNCIWINDTEGLMQFTLADQQFHYIDRLKNFVNRAAGISLDTANRVWIGTGDKGLIIYDPQTGSVERPFETDAGLSRKANEFNYRIYCDRDGIVWIGYWISSDKGINQVSPVLKSLRRYTDTTFGGLIDKSTDGRIWIIAGHDLKIFNPATDSFQVIKTKDLSEIGDHRNIYFVGRGRSAQKAWTTGEQTGELFEMDILSKRCRPVPIMDGKNNRIHPWLLSGVKIDRGQDDLFIGALPEQKYGIFLLNKDSSVVHQLPTIINGDFAGWESDGDRMVFLRRHGEDSNLTYT